MSRNKYPKPKKCPHCGKPLSEYDGRCWSKECKNVPMVPVPNRALSYDLPKKGRDES